MTNGGVLNSTETPVGQSAPVPHNRTTSEPCRPRILALFDADIHVTVTDTLRLDCRAVGFPPPTVSWLLPVDVIDDVSSDVTRVSKSHRGTQVVYFACSDPFTIYIIIRPHRMYSTCATYFSPMSHLPWSVCLHVCLSVSVLGKPCKTTNEMPFGSDSCVLKEQCVLNGVHIGATWRIQLNDPCASTMRPRSNDFDHLF